MLTIFENQMSTLRNLYVSIKTNSTLPTVEQVYVVPTPTTTQISDINWGSFKIVDTVVGLLLLIISVIAFYKLWHINADVDEEIKQLVDNAPAPPEVKSPSAASASDQLQYELLDAAEEAKVSTDKATITDLRANFQIVSSEGDSNFENETVSDGLSTRCHCRLRDPKGKFAKRL